MADSLSLFQQLPDSVLLHIFSFLDGVTLTTASSVCVQWNRVASDEVLWRDLVKGIIKKNVSLAQGKGSWKREYKRLLYHAPTELSQEVAGHTDEVYFLSFSPSGRYIASVGKDGTCRLWNYGSKVTLQNTVGPFFNPPPKTRFCEFNESETMLLITGLTHIYDLEGSIFAAVVSIPDLSLLYAVKGEFPNFRGAWLNDTHFLIAHRFYSQNNYIKLEAHEVNPTVKKKGKRIEDLFVKCQSKAKDVLVTHNYSSRNDFIRVMDPSKWGDLSQYYDFTNEYNEDVKPGYSGSLKDQTNWEPANSGDNISDIEVDGDELLDDEKESELKPRNNYSRDEDLSSDDSMEDDLYNSDSESDNVDDFALYYQMVQDARGMAKYSQSQKENIKYQMTKEDDCRPYSEVLREIQVKGEKIIQLVHCSRRDEDKCTVAFYAVKEGEVTSVKPFKKLKMDAGILGLRMSLDHRYIVYSFRNLKEMEHFWGYELEILIVVYDLILDQCWNTVFVGGTCSSDDHLSYIFPDLSEDFVAIGDETVQGHLWDHHYGTEIQSNIIHQDSGGRSYGLNAVTFHPLDQETLVTAGDDKLLKVWRSKNRLAEMSKTIGRDLKGKEKNCDRTDKTDDLGEDPKDTKTDKRKNPPRRSKLCSCIKKHDA
ncbi:uncharacterized protein LOC133181746 [Saccostrea echinata]|uniref:uncharacterized protein LOC133181746 n=1 Tax=Saccostrea echinata TaxID=191078 RepID=UPI002A8251B3|nr:uncharacterized protein LOC133181746 [Saccostrea echinata]